MTCSNGMFGGEGRGAVQRLFAKAGSGAGAYLCGGTRSLPPAQPTAHSTCRLPTSTVPERIGARCYVHCTHSQERTSWGAWPLGRVAEGPSWEAR